MGTHRGTSVININNRVTLGCATLFVSMGSIFKYLQNLNLLALTLRNVT